MADDRQPDITALSGIQTALDLSNQNLSANFQALIAALASIFPQVSSITGGTFALGAAATTTVSDTLTQANSFIAAFPQNAAAATLQGSAKSLYVSARTANASFAVTTGNGVAAAGTEGFLYILINL